MLYGFLLYHPYSNNKNVNDIRRPFDFIFRLKCYSFLTNFEPFNIRWVTQYRWNALVSASSVEYDKLHYQCMLTKTFASLFSFQCNEVKCAATKNNKNANIRSIFTLPCCRKRSIIYTCHSGLGICPLGTSGSATPHWKTQTNQIA